MTRSTDSASDLMRRFLARTGLTGDVTPTRYLWTDAFACCNCLGLAQSTGESSYRDLATRLVDQVHAILGRHRADDSRTGWISGLDEARGKRHPTAAGLRIGKRLPERRADEALDERTEWDRDGQYFHYLTKWMHALTQTARVTGDARFNAWALELADAACDAFVYQPAHAGGKRMYWKMSIDLSRPLVTSMGHHDPLDGYISCLQAAATAASISSDEPRADIDGHVVELAAMIRRDTLASADPLGIGGLLADSARLGQLIAAGAVSDDGLLEALLGAALAGLDHYAQKREWQLPASRRLAFRELGLAIGLGASPLLRGLLERSAGSFASRSGLDELLGALASFRPLGAEIRAFWLEPRHREATTWTGHRDINDVMLATSLAPGGFLALG